MCFRSINLCQITPLQNITSTDMGPYIVVNQNYFCNFSTVKHSTSEN